MPVRPHQHPALDPPAYVRAMKGFLRPNERITVRIGDARFGGPGIRMQTNAEQEFPLKVFVDAVATTNSSKFPTRPRLPCCPASPTRGLHDCRRCDEPNQPFRLGIMPLDRWGNATDQFDGALGSSPPGRSRGFPTRLSFTRDSSARRSTASTRLTPASSPSNCVTEAAGCFACQTRCGSDRPKK